ncbi:MAG TPA: hypothetical protein VH142_13230 [Polyangiaceae bacterium]|jgi:hypothetical protein|nr:hypothetical protein [Polyangiaceae bacterium]
MTIVSSIQRAWPAHGIFIVVGRNVVDTTDARRRALVDSLITHFVEAGQMQILPDAPVAPKGAV